MNKIEVKNEIAKIFLIHLGSNAKEFKPLAEDIVKFIMEVFTVAIICKTCKKVYKCLLDSDVEKKRECTDCWIKRVREEKASTKK